MRLGLLLAGSTLLLAGAPAAAQQAAGAPATRIAPSGRATTQITVTVPGAAGAQPTSLPVRIDYGQPHARGRAVAGTLVPYDQVWRTGANESTSLVTPVDLEIGGLRVPKGTYTLYSLLTRSGWKLIVNRQTGQWGTQYDQAQDVGRVDMTVRQQAEAQESFSMTLVPGGDVPLGGTLVLSWGTLHGSVPWRVVGPVSAAR